MDLSEYSTITVIHLKYIHRIKNYGLLGHLRSVLFDGF